MGPLFGAIAIQLITQVHAENGDGVLKAQQKTIAAGITGPEGHYISRPDFLEVHSKFWLAGAVSPSAALSPSKTRCVLQYKFVKRGFS